MKKEFIKYRHFLKALTCQRFFIWNYLDNIENKDYSKQEDLKKFWEEAKMGETEISANQIVALTFSKFDEALLSILTKDKNKFIVVRGKKLEERIANTKKLLNESKILINPAFEYKNCVSTPFAFDNEKKIIINIKYSTKTKRRDFLKAFYDYSIISKTEIIKDYYLYLPKTKNYKKGEIDLCFTNKIHPQVKGDIPGSLDKKGKEKNIPIIKTIKNELNSNKKSSLTFPDIERVIKQIENAKEVKKPSFEELSYDKTFWGLNPKWNELLEYLNYPFAWANGNVISKNAIINESPETDSVAWKAITKNNKAYIPIEKKDLVTKIMNKINKSKEIVWYDFEGFSLPFAPLDNVMPFHQIVFQVSTIVTSKNKEVEKENIVIDPQKIVLNDLYKIIKTVYSSKRDKYIVYNKLYENARLKEMVILLEKANHSKIEQAKQMVNHILKNTIDLYELFILNTKNKKPLIVLHDQKGKSSIKNVEKHINKNKIKLPRRIFPYEKLKISNGLVAMEVAIKRSLNLIGNQEWKQKENDLKKYCENDVRAMIMVYDFVIYILKNAL